MRFLGLKKWASHFGKRDSLFFKILKIGLVPFSFLIKRFLISGLRVTENGVMKYVRQIKKIIF